jgi:predicted metal-dependent phosphoesterase TrpH
MWRYDLHIHTNHSPGVRSSVEAVIRRAERLGLTGIAITDHDTMDGAFEAQRLTSSLEIIPGCEVTLADRSHLIGLYLQRMVQGKDLEEVILEIREQDGLVMIPHPFRAKSGLLCNGLWADEWRWAQIMSQADLIEIYNPGCSLRENQLAQKLVEHYQDSVKPTASSDAHLLWRVGTGQLCVQNLLEELSTPKKRRLRQLLNTEGTTCGIYVGNLNNTLSTPDARPASVRVKQWLKPRFPFLNSLREQSRDMLRTMRLRHVDEIRSGKKVEKLP